MYMVVSPDIAFPMSLDPWGNPRGLGDVLGMSPAGLISAGLSVVNTAISLIMNSGCGITCVETSDWANQAENLLKQNISAYFALPTPRSASDQAAALANFDTIWSGLQSRCGQSGTGTAGIRCISDREAGACTWKQTTDSPLLSYPGEPQPGTCWNWFSGYRDPIAGDPDVAATPAISSTISSVASDAQSIATSVGLPQGSGTWLLLGAAVIAGVVLIGAIK